jgi:hypothetical protein
MPEHSNPEKLKRALSLTMMFCMMMLFAGAARSSVPGLEDRWRGLIVILFILVAFILAALAAWQFIPLWVEHHRINKQVKRQYANRPVAEPMQIPNKSPGDIDSSFMPLLDQQDSESTALTPQEPAYQSNSDHVDVI